MPLPTPHKAIWSLIPVFLIIGFIFRRCTLDIMYHDTFFVFAAYHLSISFSVVLLLIGIVYWLNRHKKLIFWMTFIHLGWTIGVFAYFQFHASFCHSENLRHLGFMGEGLFLIFLTVLFQILLLINVRRSKVV